MILMRKMTRQLVRSVLNSDDHGMKNIKDEVGFRSKDFCEKMIYLAWSRDSV